MDFDTFQKGKGIFSWPSELHLDVNYQKIIHSIIILLSLGGGEKGPDLRLA